MNILICFGTRPEAIKMAPVIFELRRRGIKYKICVTAQHREMLDQVMSFFGLIPDYDLKLMKTNQTLNLLSGNILLSMDEVFLKEKPNLVLVHGDTTTSVMVAWSAFHHKISVGHVEAGLRTFQPYSPFPEELNRQITGRLSSLHFAPTQNAKENLIKENIIENIIYITGNTIVDALIYGKMKIKSLDSNYFKSELCLKSEIPERFILVTGHRRENFGRGLENICQALLEIINRNDIEIIYPVHLNPNVENTVIEMLGETEGLHLVKPVSYPTMLWLMQNCEFIISDSGGIQEEAPSFNKKVLVTREFSERTEGLAKGFSIMVGTDKSKIIDEANYLIRASETIKSSNPYGDGKASSRIVDVIQDFLNED